MSKSLIIGDMHTTVPNLNESNKLIDFIISTAKKEKVQKIEFLGDLFHTHAVIRVEVLDFWLKAFERIDKLKGIECIALVGNHDMQNAKQSNLNSLEVFASKSKKRKIVNEPIQIDNNCYIPYINGKDKFIQEAKKMYELGATNILFAHQTFTGATYENGFFAEDGIDPALVPQEIIISGHIHKKQIIGKCTYPGTPKWDTMSDANEEKGIWVYEFDDSNKIIDKKFISTKEVVTPIYKICFKEGENEPKLHTNARNYLELTGKTAWINKMKKKYKGKAHIKAKPIDRKVRKTNTSNILDIFLFLEGNNFEPIDKISKQDIKQYIRGFDE
jgi:DNA repair exonuclease SbcCD nuclease subunit